MPVRASLDSHFRSKVNANLCPNFTILSYISICISVGTSFWHITCESTIIVMEKAPIFFERLLKAKDITWSNKHL